MDSAHYRQRSATLKSVTNPQPMTLADAVEEWLKVKTAGRGLSPHTIRAYRADIATFAAHLLAANTRDRDAAHRFHISDLTAHAVTRALSSRQRAGAADKTRARLHGTLSACSATSFSKAPSPSTR